LEEKKKNGIFSNSKNYINGESGQLALGKYIVIAIIAFITVAALIVFFFLIYRYHGFNAVWNKLMHILQPIIIGAVVAYLINPTMKFIEKWVIKVCEKAKLSEAKAKKIGRYVGTFGALAFLILIVGIILGMLIPQLIASIRQLIYTLPRNANNISEWINNKLPKNSGMGEDIEASINHAVYDIQKKFNDMISNSSDTLFKYLGGITNGVFQFVKIVLNIFIGFIISTYILLSKEKFVGRAKKTVYTVFPAKAGNKIIDIARHSDKIFGGFITGKLLDSAIIGCICYICVRIMNMPYALLVSVIVGVTNIIPFFGPYFGAIPSFVLIVITNPIKGLYFLLFIFVLQQIDGNIIGPKIIGETTGLSTFGVVFSILLGSGLFGVPGMVLGVPVFGVISYLAKEVAEVILKRKNISKDSDDYATLEKIDVATGEMIYMKPEEKEEKAVEKEEA